MAATKKVLEKKLKLSLDLKALEADVKKFTATMTKNLKAVDIKNLSPKLFQDLTKECAKLLKANQDISKILLNNKKTAGSLTTEEEKQAKVADQLKKQIEAYNKAIQNVQKSVGGSNDEFQKSYKALQGLIAAHRDIEDIEDKELQNAVKQAAAIQKEAALTRNLAQTTAGYDKELAKASTRIKEVIARLNTGSKSTDDLAHSASETSSILASMRNYSKENSAEFEKQSELAQEQASIIADQLKKQIEAGNATKEQVNQYLKLNSEIAKAQKGVKGILETEKARLKTAKEQKTQMYQDKYGQGGAGVARGADAAKSGISTVGNIATTSSPVSATLDAVSGVDMGLVSTVAGPIIAAVKVALALNQRRVDMRREVSQIYGLGTSRSDIRQGGRQDLSERLNTINDDFNVSRQESVSIMTPLLQAGASLDRLSLTSGTLEQSLQDVTYAASTLGLESGHLSSMMVAEAQRRGSMNKDLKSSSVAILRLASAGKQSGMGLEAFMGQASAMSQAVGGFSGNLEAQSARLFKAAQSGVMTAQELANMANMQQGQKSKVEGAGLMTSYIMQGGLGGLEKDIETRIKKMKTGTAADKAQAKILAASLESYRGGNYSKGNIDTLSNAIWQDPTMRNKALDNRFNLGNARDEYKKAQASGNEAEMARILALVQSNTSYYGGLDATEKDNYIKEFMATAGSQRASTESILAGKDSQATYLGELRTVEDEISAKITTITDMLMKPPDIFGMIGEKVSGIFSFLTGGKSPEEKAAEKAAKKNVNASFWLGNSPEDEQKWMKEHKGYSYDGNANWNPIAGGRRGEGYIDPATGKFISKEQRVLDTQEYLREAIGSSNLGGDYWKQQRDSMLTQAAYVDLNSGSPTGLTERQSLIITVINQMYPGE